MSNYQIHILFVILFTFFSGLCRSQNEGIYTLKVNPENISSDELQEEKATSYLNTARKLAYENPDSALYLANKALLIAQEIKDQQLEGSAFRRLGLILYGQDDISSALHFLHRGKDLLEKGESIKDRLFVYNNLGAVYEYLGENQQALKYYFKSLEEAELSEDVPRQISALSNLGDLSVRIKQYKSAQDFLTRGLGLLAEEKNEQLKARLEMQLATACVHLNKLDESLGFFQQAMAFFSGQDDQESKLYLAHCLNGLGIIDRRKGNLTSARENYQKALKLYQEIGSPDAIIGYLSLGTLAQDEDKHQEAIQLFQEALNSPQLQDNLNHQKNLYWNLSLSYNQVKEIEKAYEFQNAYALITDSIYHAEIQETTSRAELLYTKARSERVEEAAKSALERQRTLNYYLLGAFSIVGLLAIVFFQSMRLNRQRKDSLEKELSFKEESNKLLLVEMLKDHEVENLNAMLDGQEHERKRIARDLHDSLGGTLAAVQLTLASLERKLPEMNDKAKHTYDKAENLLDQAYQQMRGISHNLADLSLKEGGLSPALKQLKETLSENTQLDIRMNYTSLGDKRLDSNVEQHSYRITQELFQNIIKHAEASTIEYELNYSPLKLHISIKDNGKGFEYEPGSKVTGIGLNNIMTRVRQLDGEMEIQSKPGEGTQIEVDIPLVLS